MISTLDVYESLHLIRKQPKWAAEDGRVELADEEDEEDKPPPPPQIPSSCACKWCCKWTVCEHTGLVASVFSPEYKVPDKLVVETPALRKKTNSIRGTAGLKRKQLIREISRQKSKSTNKLAYMDQLEPLPRAVAAEPLPAESQPAPADKFVVPEPTVPSTLDEEVLIDICRHG